MEISSSNTVSTKLQRIAELAREAPHMVITSLSHHVDLEFLKEAYDRTRKDGAVGVDGVTAEMYEQKLEDNLQSLLDRFKSGIYKAPPVKRVHISKAGSDKTRPLGIPTFEDKILQTAVKMLLEAVYEQDFLDCSYGYRPGRSQHQALERIWQTTMRVWGGGWVIEADIRNFFGEVQHSHLRDFLDQRVRDGVIRRTIHKWLKAGVMEFGKLSFPEKGTPQGGVASPILANIYLHDVLDKWFEEQVKPHLKGRAELIRYADDFICVFDREEDARSVMKVLPKRFEKYGLALHPEKTRLIDFRRGQSGPDDDDDDPRSFDFLGLHHFWGKSKTGNPVVKQATSRSRFKRAIAAISKWCRENRHLPMNEQREKLSKKLTGHYSYYGVTGNRPGLSRYHRMVERIWFKWLNRRSQKRSFPWDKFTGYLKRCPLPHPKMYASALKA